MDTQARAVANSDFLSELAKGAPKGTTLWVNHFKGEPSEGRPGIWNGEPYGPTLAAGSIDAWADCNTYFCVSALSADKNGELRRRKTHFCRMLALVVDDIDLNDIMGAISYVITTSPGKHQVGIFLDADCADSANADLCDAVLKELVLRGAVALDKSGNNVVRYVRLPVGENQKPRETGHFSHELMIWSPGVRLSLADAAAAFGVDVDDIKSRMRKEKPGAASESAERESQADKLKRTIKQILAGEAYHESLIEIAASMIASGMHSGAAKNLLRALMEATPPAGRDARWKMRYADIGRAVDTAEAKFKAAKEEATDAPPPDIFLSLSKLREASRSISWAVKHILPADSVGVMFGGSGTFKSFIALDMALHIAHGLPWCGKKTKRGPVIYIAAEGGAGLWRRIEAWHKDRRLSFEAIEMYVVPVSLDLIQDSGVVVAGAALVGVVPALVVVDTMSQTFAGEENSANEVANYLRVIGNSFRALWRAAVMVLHHSGHMATERPRGSSAIRANVDFMFGVFRDEQEMLARVECHKQKDGDQFKELPFALNLQQLGFDEDGETVSSLVARYIETDEELQARKEYEASRGACGQDKVLLSMAQVGMNYEALRIAFYSTFPEGTKTHTKKVAMQRAWSNLERQGKVGKGKDPITNLWIITYVAAH